MNKVRFRAINFYGYPGRIYRKGKKYSGIIKAPSGVWFFCHENSKEKVLLKLKIRAAVWAAWAGEKVFNLDLQADVNN